MTDSRRPGPARPPVRLRPAPPIDPPFVEEPAEGWPRPVAAQLALDLFEAHRRAPSHPGRRPHDPGPAPGGPGRSAPTAPPPLALVTATPEATRAAQRFVATCLEILNGYRPLGQIRPMSELARSAEVVQELTRAAARTGPVRRRSTRPTVRLRRLRVCEPRPAAVEAAAVLAGGAGRTWAMALRLEHRRGRWLCVAMQVL
ncbi:Rv3235 family protein [Micromonospora okii]|uniref:Rv3235 family protein n=1 Tax=Micromonospora okii TaxID=1182970 RepID=UPI001E452B26|nr:Rv3235 family protein [Micromonospora okii]